MEEQEHLRYPIGRFECPNPITENDINGWVMDMEALPSKLRTLVTGLTDEQLDTSYRPGGWTVRQVVHHIADSHHHSYTRFKWALTENEPLIKVYREKEWSSLHDAKTAPVELSLNYLVALHAKLVFLLRNLTQEQLEKVYCHPEGNTRISVAQNIGKYAWHGNHHMAHIGNLIKRKGW